VWFYINLSRRGPAVPGAPDPGLPDPGVPEGYPRSPDPAEGPRGTQTPSPGPGKLRPPLRERLM